MLFGEISTEVAWEIPWSESASAFRQIGPVTPLVFIMLTCMPPFMAVKGQNEQVKQSFTCCSRKSDDAVYLREYNSNFNYVFEETQVAQRPYQPCAKCSFDSAFLCCGLITDIAIPVHV